MAAPKGPLTTKNNLTGQDEVIVALSGTTAKTWTHNFNAYPKEIRVLTENGGVNLQGTGSGQVTPSCGSANAITLTPVTFTGNARVIIIWDYSPNVQNGMPTSNFA